MCGYLFFPEEESGLQFAQRFPSIRRWLEAIRAMPGWADRTISFRASDWHRGGSRDAVLD
jgi:hypothetical protein